MTVKERIAALRAGMKENGVDACVVFDSDEHMSEYLPAHYRERSWISGFTGSAGTVVVTAGAAGGTICRRGSSSPAAASPSTGRRTPGWSPWWTTCWRRCRRGA